MDVAEQLVRNTIDINYPDLPKEAVDATKLHILHTIATILGGSQTAGCNTMVELAKEWGGKKESTVLAYGGKVPAISAALANAVMAHALDYCMNDDRTFYKSSVVVVPAALAVGEREKISGKEFLTAVCLGIDSSIRIALGINPKPAHALSWMIGGFASAIACSKILKLDQERMLDAMSIAYCQVSRGGMSGITPDLTKRLMPGVTARSGVFSALLAEKGFPSVRGVLQGRQGYYCTYHGTEGDLESVTANLGKVFEVVNVGPKGYPCCRFLHGPIDAALAVVNEHNIAPDDVDKVSVFVSYQNLAPLAEETTPQILNIRRHPRWVVDAQFSTAWAVASAIVKRRAFIEEFSEEGIKDPDVNKMADRVTPIDDPALARTDSVLTPTIVEIRTKTGAVFSKRVDFPKGNPNNPITFEETKENFRKCAAHTPGPLSRKKVEQAIEMIEELQDVEDVSELSRMLARG